MKNNIKYLGLFAVLSASLLAACGSDKSSSSEQEASEDAALKSASQLGRIKAALTVPEESKHDVAMAQFNVVAIDGDCSDTPLATTTSAIEEEGLVASLDPSGADGTRAFADGLMTLPPGEYKVCVQPLQADGSPSEECAVAEGTGTVFAELTTEIVLTSQCDGNANGALDVVVTLNEPPIITNISIDESKFITTCETATITIDAEDINGDELTYDWEQVSGTSGGAFVGGDDGTATFTPDVAGDYEFKVIVTDALGAQTSLTFPIHVSEADGSCSSECPEGTVDAGDYCWVQAELFESGIQSCERFDLNGAASIVDGVAWTPELMTEVTTAFGCTDMGDTGCCQAALYLDTASNECFTYSYTVDSGQDFTNGVSIPGQAAALHICQRP